MYKLNHYEILAPLYIKQLQKKKHLEDEYVLHIYDLSMSELDGIGNFYV